MKILKLKDILNELKSEADSEEINLRMVDSDLAKREIVELIKSKPDCLTSDIIIQLKLDRVDNAGMECH